jgi:hypothetical protein
VGLQLVRLLKQGPTMQHRIACERGSGFAPFPVKPCTHVKMIPGAAKRKLRTQVKRKNTHTRRGKEWNKAVSAPHPHAHHYKPLCFRFLPLDTLTKGCSIFDSLSYWRLPTPDHNRTCTQTWRSHVIPRAHSSHYFSYLSCYLLE